MDDRRIVELYWERNERAIEETKSKYGRYCYAIAYNILNCREDAEECENDTYLDAWERIPPERPAPLSGFLGMLTRRISLDRWRKQHAQKRGGGEVALSFDELEECVPSGKSIDEELEAERLAGLLNAFLESLPELEGDVFLRRYWYFDPIKVIAKRYGMGQSRVKMMLKRTRDRLKETLEKEGIFL